MKKIVFFALGILGALLIVACSSGNKAQPTSSIEGIKQAGVIRIGVFGDVPPFGYLDDQRVNQGYDIYFAKRIAKELLGDESKIQYVVVEAANRVSLLEANKVDLMVANFTQTPQRAQKVDFTLPYMKTALGVAVPSNSKMTKIEDLKGKNVIVVKGTTADAYMSTNYPEIKTTKYDQNSEAYAAMLDSRGDAFVHDNTLLFAWVKDKPKFKMAIKELGNNDVIAAAVKKNNAELKKFVDDLIVKLGQEQFFHKAYDATLKDYFPSDVTADDIVVEGGKL